MKSYFEPDTEWGELVCVHWGGWGEGGKSVWNYKTILWFCRQDWVVPESSSQNRVEDNIAISCRPTPLQTKLRQSRIDFREIINWTNCVFYFWQQSGPLCQLWRSQFVIEMLRSSHQLSLSFRVVLEIRAIERVMQCIEMQCSKLLMTDRTVAIPPSHLPISLQRRLYLEKNRCRLELLVNHKTEGLEWKLFIWTVDNWSWFYWDKTRLICTERETFRKIETGNSKTLIDT